MCYTLYESNRVFVNAASSGLNLLSFVRLLLGVFLLLILNEISLDLLVFSLLDVVALTALIFIIFVVLIIIIVHKVVVGSLRDGLSEEFSAHLGGKHLFTHLEVFFLSTGSSSELSCQNLFL